MNYTKANQCLTQDDEDDLEQASDCFEPKGLTGAVYSVLHDMVCILAVVVLVFVFIVRPVGVSGCSMYPTLVGVELSAGTQGDFLLLRSNFLCTSYHPGDIVVASVPSFQDGELIVKRVVAVGGQTVRFQEDADGYYHVYVDDVLQCETHINEPMRAKGCMTDGYTDTVPEGCYFLMGDNRNNSADSRYSDIGMVDGRNIVGKAMLLVIPGQDAQQGGIRSWNRIGIIEDGDD
ncbi:MAG: signal peptidase I [Oscillospiraceae bacterium]|nr:signal peptidase I [Oscillospiraceae bacterium]